MNAVTAWSEELHAWALPQALLDAAPESPYGFDASLFRARAERSATAPPSPTTVRALDALPHGGSVLDVGVGAGATSLPLVNRASTITGVDGQADMLEQFMDAAKGSNVSVATVHGAWPAAEAEAPVADVVVCGHVLYNVQELEPFVRALTSHARERVIVELTDAHPWAWMGFLYERFHDLARPAGPTAELCGAAIGELGIEVRSERSEAPFAGGFRTREAAVALVRRRLCLTADHDDEIVVALGSLLAERDGLWSAGPATTKYATMWWTP